MRTSVWKATTAAALGLAVLFAVRPPWPRHAAAATALPGASSSTGAEASGPSSGPASGPSRSAVLADRLHAARSTTEACEALEALGRVGDGTAAAAIVEASRARSHVYVRRCALTELRHVGGEPALQRLLEATHDPEPTTRGIALDSLAQRDDELARAMVIAAARGGEPSERVAALTALAHARVPGVVPFVEEALKTANAAQQIELAATLGQYGDPSALPALTRIAASPAELARGAALTAAASLGTPGMALVQATFAKSAKDAVEVLDALSTIDSDDVRAFLIRAADDGRPAVAAKALEELASFDGEDVRAAVVMHAGSRDPASATAAARWLALRGDGQAVPSLVDAAQSLDSDAAGNALDALGGLETDAAHDAILSLASRPGVARDRALRQLADSPRGAPEARSLALRMMLDEGGSVAETGLSVLSSDDSPEATRAIAEAARGKGSLGREAVQALGQRHDEASLVALVDIARKPDEGAPRELALMELADSKDPRALRALVDAASDPELRQTALSSLARAGGADAERALRAAATSSDVQARAAAAQAMVGETPASLLPQLKALAHDSDGSVASPAFQALRSTDPTSALGLVAEQLHDRDAETRAQAVGWAGQLDGEAARPLLIQALRDPDPAVVVAAASTLGSTGGSDAQQALLDVVTGSSSSDEARRAAAQALDAMGGAAARDHAEIIQKWMPDEGDSASGDDESGEP
ncbi:MAG TPA: HEAT repeat domain-containing protein [Polyangiaceae bacterium]|jgi:HEAT repeat protein